MSTHNRRPFDVRDLTSLVELVILALVLIVGLLLVGCTGSVQFGADLEVSPDVVHAMRDVAIARTQAENAKPQVHDCPGDSRVP